MQRLTLSVFLAVLLPAAAVADAPADRFERAVYLEETVGDLASAIDLYRSVCRDPATSRPIAAQAYFRLASSYLQVGDRGAAVRTIDALVEGFPEQHGLVAQARQLLPAEVDDKAVTLGRGVAPHAALDEVNRAYAAAFRAADTAAIAALYTDDAYLLEADAEIERGAAGHVARMRELFDLLELHEIRPRMAVTIVGREVIGPIAYEVGYYSVLLPIGADEHTVRGKYVGIYRQAADGTWRIHVDASNSLPMRVADWRSYGAAIEAILGGS